MNKSFYLTLFLSFKIFCSNNYLIEDRGLANKIESYEKFLYLKLRFIRNNSSRLNKEFNDYLTSKYGNNLYVRAVFLRTYINTLYPRINSEMIYANQRLMSLYSELFNNFNQDRLHYFIQKKMTTHSKLINSPKYLLKEYNDSILHMANFIYEQRFCLPQITSK